MGIKLLLIFVTLTMVAMLVLCYMIIFTKKGRHIRPVIKSITKIVTLSSTMTLAGVLTYLLMYYKPGLYVITIGSVLTATLCFMLLIVERWDIG